METESLTSAIEAILFASDKPVTTDRIKEVFGEDYPITDEEIRTHLDAITERHQKSTSGFELREAQGGFHFVTKPSNAEWVRRFLQTKPFRLGRSALETLAIIAYRQPVTRAEIDQVRGIDSSHLLRTLIERGLVKMAGKAEIPGRPVQYGTTPRFLEVLGLKSHSELPPLTELDQLQGHTEDHLAKLEEGLDRFMVDAGQSAEVAQEEDEAGLKEISDVIDTAARTGEREVHESRVHLEVAQANEEALAAFQSLRGKRKKKTVTFDELQSHPTSQSESAVSESVQEAAAGEKVEETGGAEAQLEGLSETIPGEIISETNTLEAEPPLSQ